MLRKYEGLFILNTAGKEENAKELVEKIEKEVENAGAKIHKVERMDKRPFARVAQKVESGYYVNIVFDMAPDKLADFRTKLKLNPDVFRVTFMKSSSIDAAPREPAEAKK